MTTSKDPDELKIPAYLRKKAIVSQSRQKLILTALDRKEAGLKYNSKKATAKTLFQTSRLSNQEKKETMSPFDKPEKQRKRPVLPEAREQPVMEQVIEREIRAPSIFLPIGVVTHYLDKINVAIIKLSAPLKVGEYILFQGDGCCFTQMVEEMQIDRQPVKKAKKGSHIGLKVERKCTLNSAVYVLKS